MADHLSPGCEKTESTTSEHASPNEQPTTATNHGMMGNHAVTSAEVSVGTEPASNVVEREDPVGPGEIEAQEDPSVSGNQDDDINSAKNKSRDRSQPPSILDQDPQGEEKDKSSIVLQIKDLREKLQKLEQQAIPETRLQDIEAEWERDLQRLGPRHEMERWEERKKKMHASLLRDSIPYAEGRSWINSVAGEAEERMNDELKYSEEILKLRKKWEKTQKSLKEGQYFGEDSDSDSGFDSDHLEEHWRIKERRLYMTFDFERKVLRESYELKKRRQIRRADQRRMREQERIRDRGQQRGQPEEEHNQNDPEEPEDETPFIGPMNRPEPAPSAISELNRRPWGEFKDSRGKCEEDSFAIDVLIGEPVIEVYDTSYDVRLPKHFEKRPRVSHRPIATGSPLAERIRINSREISAIFAGICGSDISSPPGGITLIRPFKSLVFYDGEIRAAYEKLKLKFTETEHHENPKAHGPPEPGAEPAQTTETHTLSEAQIEKGWNEGEEQKHEEEEMEVEVDIHSRAAYDHMKLLVEFLDNDIAQRIKHLNGPACKKVFFSDLWYLFQPGQHVVHNDGKQAYRILSVRSPTHRAADPWPRWWKAEENDDIPMVIKCVYIDFDGKLLGPVSRNFSIKSFDGERLVTSLAIYPLRFHAPPQTAPDKTLRQHLVDRGRQFLKVSAVHLGTVRPMYYAGPALTTGDEVESQVVVDFEATFTTDDGDGQNPAISEVEEQQPSSRTKADSTKRSRRDWRPELETLLGNDEEVEVEPKRCKANCCRDEILHDDSDMDKKRNEAFRGELLDQATRDKDGAPPPMLIPRPLDLENPEAGLTEDDLVIMCYRVFGFILRNRKWGQLDLTYLKEAKDMRGKSPKPAGTTDQVKEDALDQDLVLPEGHSKMILSLISQHFRDKGKAQVRTDVVRGKGKGLILLLHGPPGVGKTTTAESVAENFQKPLFQITCGDLGTTASEVEAALEKNFGLASRWGCVLLLDEADVFLAQRTKDDFQRNGLVAVFLRVLEYYAGVLFLTTNRVGDFDEAFASRIHISLYYPDLGRKETLDVLTRNLGLLRERFPADALQKLQLDDALIGDYVGSYFDKNPFDRWNGRQIRNACQTALALAEFDAGGRDNDPPGSNSSNPNPTEVHLQRNHFEMVGKAYLEFSSYVQNLYGTNAARRAKEAGLRAMWVDPKDNNRVVGSIGPKDKHELKTRFRAKARGQYQQQTGNPPATQVPAGNQAFPPAQPTQMYAPTAYAPPPSNPLQQPILGQAITYDYPQQQQQQQQYQHTQYSSYSAPAPQQQATVQDPYYRKPHYAVDNGQYQQQPSSHLQVPLHGAPPPSPGPPQQQYLPLAPPQHHQQGPAYGHHQQQQQQQPTGWSTGSGYESGNTQRPEGPPDGRGGGGGGGTLSHQHGQQPPPPPPPLPPAGGL